MYIGKSWSIKFKNDRSETCFAEGLTDLFCWSDGFNISFYKWNRWIYAIAFFMSCFINCGILFFGKNTLENVIHFQVDLYWTVPVKAGPLFAKPCFEKFCRCFLVFISSFCKTIYSLCNLHDMRLFSWLITGARFCHFEVFGWGRVKRFQSYSQTLSYYIHRNLWFQAMIQLKNV